jgi:hypothetical protein
MKLPVEMRDCEPPPFLKSWRNVNIAVLAWLAFLIFLFYEFTEYFS